MKIEFDDAYNDVHFSVTDCAASTHIKKKVWCNKIEKQRVFYVSYYDEDLIFFSIKQHLRTQDIP